MDAQGHMYRRAYNDKCFDIRVYIQLKTFEMPLDCFELADSQQISLRHIYIFHKFAQTCRKELRYVWWILLLFIQFSFVGNRFKMFMRA